MMMATRSNVAAAVLLIGLACADASAQGRSDGRGRGNDGKDNKDNSSSRGADNRRGDNRGGDSNVSVVVFRDNDRVAFRDYFARNRITGQPLPPGIAKNLARGKPLPPGIAKKVAPAGLIAVGPRLSPGVTMLIVGDRVVAVRNNIVVDILSGLF